MSNIIEQAIKYFDGYGSPYDELLTELLESAIPIPAGEWHEELNHVIWWRLPVEEPPYVGSPLCDDWTEDYYTHFTKLIEPLEN